MLGPASSMQTEILPLNKADFSPDAGQPSAFYDWQTSVINYDDDGQVSFIKVGTASGALNKLGIDLQ